MNKIAWVMCVLLIQGFAVADAPATRPATQPATVTGSIGKPFANLSKSTSALGRSGVLFIRSQDRWDEINKLVGDLTPDTPLPKLDFARQSVVLIYAAGRRDRDAFTFSKSDLTASPPELAFRLRWDSSVVSPDAALAKLLKELPGRKLDMKLRSIEINQIPLSDALGFFTDIADIKFTIDRPSFAAVGVDCEKSQVSLTQYDATLGSVLLQIFAAVLPPNVIPHFTADANGITVTAIADPRSTKLILAVIPATPTVCVALSSQPADPEPPPANLEFLAVLGGKDGGDVVDGLQAVITPKAATIKPGDDIVIDFALHLADPGDAKPQPFGVIPRSVFVWEALHSEGYRVVAFFVTTPDGKTALLGHKAEDVSNVPPYCHNIAAKKPYYLGDKSLKDLGLDTSAPGTYTITGLYEETVGDAGKTPMWGGSIATNTVTVEVK